MSDNKNYVSNKEVQSAFDGDSKIKYLKEKLIALSVVVVLIVGGLVFYNMQKTVETKNAKNDSEIINDDPLQAAAGNEFEEIEYNQKENSAISEENEFSPDTTSDISKVTPTVEKKKTNIEQPVIEKPKVEKLKIIETKLKRTPNKNEITWNKELTEAADEIRIVFKDAKGRVWADETVSGQNSFYYDPGNSEAGGISTDITITPIFNGKNVKLTGTLNIKGQFFKCS